MNINMSIKYKTSSLLFIIACQSFAGNDLIPSSITSIYTQNLQNNLIENSQAYDVIGNNISNCVVDDMTAHVGAVIAGNSWTSNVQNAFPGPCTGSPYMYRYHWVRDGALTMLFVIDEVNSGNSSWNNDYLSNYISWTETAQSATNPSPSDGVNTLGQPKFNLDATIYSGGWCRPQNDGPALRALAQMGVMNTGELVDSSLITANLDYVANNYNQMGCDLWEQTNAFHFFTTMVQFRALVEAIYLHSKGGLEISNLESYCSAAADISSEYLNSGYYVSPANDNNSYGSFSNLANTFMSSRFVAPGENSETLPDFGSYSKGDYSWNAKVGMFLDIGVTLGYLHGTPSETAYQAANNICQTQYQQSINAPIAINNDVLLNSIGAYTSLMMDSDNPYTADGKPLYYPLNQNNIGYFGRYPGDFYSGTNEQDFDAGAWNLATSAIANFYYQFAIYLYSQSSFTVNSNNFAFINTANNISNSQLSIEIGSTVTSSSSVTISQMANMFIAAGDNLLVNQAKYSITPAVNGSCSTNNTPTQTAQCTYISNAGSDAICSDKGVSAETVTIPLANLSDLSNNCVHLSEQVYIGTAASGYNANFAGFQASSEDLSWSYVEFLSALKTREAAVSN